MRALLSVLLGTQTWTVGSRVHVAAPVYARADTLGAGVKTLRVAGDKGTLVQGPAGSSTVYGASWYVDYDTPPDGWSTAKYLTLDALAPADTINRSWTLGLRVRTTGGNVYVRVDSTCCSRVADSLPAGITGTLVGGPWKATDNGVRWRVAWDAHTTGWSRQELMTRDSSATPPPPPPPPAPTVATIRIDGFLSGGSFSFGNVGATHQFVATTFDAAGTPLVGRLVTWRASRPDIASVDAFGLVTAQSPGLGLDTVYATAGTATAWRLVNVSPTAPPPPPPVGGPVGCGVRIPPPVGCGMPDGTWALMGVDTVSRTYGPWFMDDTLHRPHKVVRVVVRDTTP